MLYLRIDDNSLGIAYFTLPSAREREEAMMLGRALPTDPVLTYHRHAVPTTPTFGETLRLILAQHPEASADEGVHVLVCGPVTIVPDGEVQEDQYEQTFHSCFSFTDSSDRKVFDTPVPSLHSTLLFGVKSSVVNALRRQFADVPLHIESPLGPILTHFAEHYEDNLRLRIFVNCRYRFIDVFCIDGRQLTLLNSFPVNGAPDIAYYAVAITRSLRLDTQSVPFLFMGERELMTPALTELRRFAGDTQIVSASSELGVPYATTAHADIPFELLARIFS